MEVHVSNLRAEINRFNTLVKNYENCMLNLYNTLGQTSSYWKDTNSGRFIDNIYIERKTATTAVSDMEQVKNVYSMIADRYAALGNNIKFELAARVAVKSNFTSYISRLNSVIAAYNSLNLGFGPSEAGAIQSQKSRIMSAKANAEALRDKVDKVFNDIQEIETQVSSKIGSINISITKDSNPSDFA